MVEPLSPSLKETPTPPLPPNPKQLSFPVLYATDPGPLDFAQWNKMAGCGHEHHEHKHDEAASERGQQFHLYQKIDFNKLQCLNEADEGSARNAFKPWEERMDATKYVESDVDEELLFNIAFVGQVKLKAVVLIGGEGEQHPSEMRLFKNRPFMTFDDAKSEPDQKFELHEDLDGSVEYPTKVARFSGVEHLSIYIPKNFGAETTRVCFIGLKGDFQGAHRHEVTICTYEARANPADHKSNAFDHVNHAVH